MKWKSFLTSSLFNFYYFPDEDGKKVDTKMKMRLKKFGRTNLIFKIKIRLHRNFHENLWKKSFTQLFRTFLTN